MYKKFGNESIDDICLYAKNYLEKYPDVIVYVGTDSKQLRWITLYATTLCFLHPGKGVHIVFERQKIDKVKDLFTRLWIETELSVKLALNLREHGIESTIDLDINPSVKYKSNMAHDASIGFVKSHMFVARTKPDAWAASCAADLLCK
jgi:predicted RNase H-related nuclease YkuK (DUF458 family)